MAALWISLRIGMPAAGSSPRGRMSAPGARKASTHADAKTAAASNAVVSPTRRAREELFDDQASTPIPARSAATRASGAVYLTG